MSKESFQYPETQPLFKTLEEISQRSNVSRGRAFEDVIRASVAALAAETMEPECFQAIEAHKAGPQGKRGVDMFPVFFAQTVDAITQFNRDVLGDLFQSAISYGENAFFMTPQPVATIMSRMLLEDVAEQSQPITIHDPCCGTGILLIEAGERQPDAELCGQDVDARCADIDAINLGLRSRYGWVICGNSLSRKVQYVYRIGHFYHESPQGLRRGVIHKVDPTQCPILPELHDQPSGLFPEQTATPATTTRPPIIEIPRWLLKLEAMRRSVPTADPIQQAPAETPKPQPPVTAATPKKQGELF